MEVDRFAGEPKDVRTSVPTETIGLLAVLYYREDENCGGKLKVTRLVSLPLSGEDSVPGPRRVGLSVVSSSVYTVYILATRDCRYSSGIK